jgi:uncharacterized protein
LTLSRLEEALGPQGGTLSAQLYLQQRGGNVEVTGSIKGTLQVPCHRCLEPVPFELDEAVALTLVPEERMAELDEEMTLSQSDLDVSFFEEDAIDLSRLVEDEALLAVPETLCEEDEEGRCTLCGKTLDELYAEPEDDKADHPFAQLKQFIK